MTFVELDQQPRFDLASILSGGDGIDRSPRWLAHAPHLAAPVPVDTELLGVLQRIPRDDPSPVASLVQAHGQAAIDRLLDAGLLLAEAGDADGTEDAARAAAARDAATRDTAAREVPWWPAALLAQSAGAWQGIDIQALRDAGDMPDSGELVRLNGPAPEHEYRRHGGDAAIGLPPPPAREFDALLRRRRTCRNFDAAAALSAEHLSTMLHRVWGAVGTRELAPGAVAVRKTSPAGGGLHAVEAYVVVQRAEGLAPGLYHYLSMQHALEPLRTMSRDEAATLVRRFIAGQDWFFDVPVMVVMTARFERLFWKYRRHAKAWRVVHLDVGHLSQTMYLSAADLGLGAFVTAAINDREIEAELALPPLREGAIAIVGFGRRDEHGTNVELTGLTPTPASLAAGIPPDV